MSNNNGGTGVSRRIEASPPPFPLRLPGVVAMVIVSFIFMGFILTVFTIIGIFVLLGCLCCLGHDINDVEDDQAVALEILEGIFRNLKGRDRSGGGRSTRKKDESEKVLGSRIYCFGSEATSELGYRECSICLEDFQKGETCLVFPVCSHLFHCECIVRWLQKKPTCPVCRTCAASKTKKTR